MAIQRHIPLIKFLGPRKLLSHPPASMPSFSSPTTSSTLSAAPSVTIRQNIQVLSYETSSLLPARYQLLPFSDAELQAIDVRID
ncbi:hypothetical protein BSLG_004435 [Batrachochytrium salamandrivorans]|nr:hypothetical protein BSLG_004435 [Batrachochytrium salamandrivorans]